MEVIFSSKCVEYMSPGHPESPQRLTTTIELLKEQKIDFIEPLPAQEKDILLAHSQELLQKVKTGNFFDPDTPNLRNIYEYARLAAGGAILAAQIAIKGKPAISLMRPPGHHAGRQALGGFCYFNNIAIAVKKAVAMVGRVAILDIDCHHGNGTEDIFLGDKNTLYVSLHQVPLYPGTGLTSQDNCLNFPLPAGIEEEKYLQVLDEALDKIREFKPELMAISCGFDTYSADPLGGMKLEQAAYKKISQRIAGLGINSFSVLEGGYSANLKYCIWEYMQGFQE